MITNPPLWLPDCGPSLEALIPPAGDGAQPANRRQRLFSWYPYRDAVCVRSRRWCPVPMHIYHGDLSLVFGASAPDEGSAHLPRNVIHDRRGRVPLVLWVSEHNDTSVGPVDTMLLLTLVAKEGPGAPANPLADYDVVAEPFRLVEAFLDRRIELFMLHWLVGGQLAADYIHEVFSMGTERAQVSVAAANDRDLPVRRFQAFSEAGRLILGGQLQDQADDNERGMQFSELMRVLGWKGSVNVVTQAALGLPVTVRTVVGPSTAKPAECSRIYVRGNFDPAYRLWNVRRGDYLRVEPESAFGDLMTELQFSPLVYGRHSGYQSVIDAETVSQHQVDGLMEVAGKHGLTPVDPPRDTPDARAWARETPQGETACVTVSLGEQTATVSLGLRTWPLVLRDGVWREDTTRGWALADLLAAFGCKPVSVVSAQPDRRPSRRIKPGAGEIRKRSAPTVAPRTKRRPR